VIAADLGATGSGKIVGGLATENACETGVQIVFFFLRKRKFDHKRFLPFVFAYHYTP
jgi:hypothetical protein